MAASLAHEILHNPVRVEVARAGKTVDRIEQYVYHVDTKSKRGVLAALLQDAAMARVILFTRTKHGADRVARGLGASGIGAFAIHGNKSQNARQAALESFRSGKVRVLVATDIAARGIDIDDITHVVNYDIPNIPESYVHRIGRTARAGKTGIAIALCAPEERAFLRDIERLTRKPLTAGAAIAGLAEVTASLPPVPSKSGDRDDEQTFERNRGRVSGRRHMPQTRPATAWHEGDPARPVEAGAAAPRGGRDERGGDRGGRPPQREGRGPSRDGERRGPPRGDRPQGERSEGRPQGDRPRFGAPRADSRGPSDRGEGRSHGHHSSKPFSNSGSRDGAGAPRGERPQQARDGQSRDGERRGPPRRDGGRDNHRSPAPRGDAPRGDGGRDFKRPERSADRGSERGGERSRDPVVSSSKPWENRPAPRSDDRSPAGGRPPHQGHRPASRGPDGRPPNRWSNGDRPRGGDRPRPPARAGRDD